MSSTPVTRSRRRVRTTLTFLALASSLVATGSLAAPASADADNVLTVVGTSDVFDSFLVQNVLEPSFEKAYPQYDLQYVSRGTGAALALARTGAASAALVHAAALENQFVAEGYSAEPYGRAVFWGDYVLLGPKSDPAGVLSGAPRDIVTAYEKVAAAGAAGRAEFVSRGGTPGTTVQEHAIWALTDGVTTCDVNASNGGGKSPSTASGACSNPIQYPSWYHATGLTQGPNVLAGDACNGYASNACDVFTDRGTFNYLQSQKSIANLGIVTRDNDVAGQDDLLINSFHAYAVNPAKFASNPNVKINLPAATAFLDWLTSPAGQKAVGDYLSAGPDRIPFIPSAAPKLTAIHPQSRLASGKSATVSGTLSNVVPGTLALSGETVNLLTRPASQPSASYVTAATTKTRSDGSYSITFTPRRNSDYVVATPRLTKIQNPSLSPVFGDLLEATQSDSWRVEVRSALTLVKATARKRKLKAVTKVSPAPADGNAKLALYAGRPGKPLTFRSIKTVKNGASRFTTTFRLPKGKFRVKLTYFNSGVAYSSSTPIRRVTSR